jgi:hypothetical protein
MQQQADEDKRRAQMRKALETELSVGFGQDKNSLASMSLDELTGMSNGLREQAKRKAEEEQRTRALEYLDMQRQGYQRNQQVWQQQQDQQAADSAFWSEFANFTTTGQTDANSIGALLQRHPQAPAARSLAVNIIEQQAKSKDAPAIGTEKVLPESDMVLVRTSNGQAQLVPRASRLNEDTKADMDLIRRSIVKFEEKLVEAKAKGDMELSGTYAREIMRLQSKLDALKSPKQPQEATLFNDSNPATPATRRYKVLELP